MGLDLDAIRMEIEKRVGAGPDQKWVANIPYTPRVKRVLALAAKEATAFNHTYLGTEHVLLGLLREGDGVAAQVLASFNVNLENTRKEILKELDPNKQSPLDEAGKSQPSSSKSMSTPNLPQPVDTTARYDVFCREQPDKVVVYRNVLFKSVRSFFPRPDAPTDWDYAELEEVDGQCVFVAKSTIVRFSPQGAAFEAEDI
jgi:ATP-dependent Clp protease ATP-binding subunit ClpA